MADIFIASARADRARVAALAKALEARGFTIAGVGDSDVGAQDGAKAVLVVWSLDGVKDAGVLAAAATAGERIAPVLIDAATVPPAFANQSSEVLTAWPRVAGQGPFERLILRLESLTAKRAAPASAIPAAVMSEAGKAVAAAENKRRFWPRVGGALGAAAIGLIGYNIWQASPRLFATPSPADAAKVCEAAQQFCLTKDQLRTLTEGQLIDAALQNASREKFEQAASAGDELAAGLLCLADALRGDDPAIAQETCTAAANLGQPLGNIGLAALLEDGKAPNVRDPAAAKALLAAAAAKGDVRAQYLVAIREHDANNFEAAKAALTPCVETGYVACRYLRAFMLENGQGEAANISEAVRIYTDLAEASPPDPDAARTLAWIMQNGAPPDISPNLPYAIVLYRRAATMGDGFSHYMLGQLAEQGRIEGEGRAEALDHYRAAVDAGNPDAAAALARLSSGDAARK
jgi:TPR repeat protein